MRALYNSRFRVYFFFFFVFLAYNFVIRTTLLVVSWDKITLSLKSFASFYGIGLFYDVMSGFYATILIVLYLMLMPNKLYHHKWHRYMGHLFLVIVLFALGFLVIAEHVFWDEFGVRFNFIAVDYLVYTKEVVGNILESYPVKTILAVNLAFALVVFYFLKSSFDKAIVFQNNFTCRVKYGLFLVALPLLAYLFVSSSVVKLENQYEKNLAYNGLYQLFSAFINNKLEYGDFYASMDKEAMLQNYRKIIAEPHGKFIDDNLDTMKRKIESSGIAHNKNVVIVLMESMSAEFLGSLGDTRGLTPNLDKLSLEGLLFTNLYATGTRTVRGMESITLSVPPSAGTSMVKQPDGKEIFSAGYVFGDNGYSTSFIYGGYGYFDNMNAFFNSNGFKTIVDRADMSKEEITFANVWGVSDENLFEKALKQFDKDHESGKNFFSLIMTTSNHRPYTYPDGKIDIPSHTNRDGAVKYADFAIGELMKNAQQKPWFKDTVFIFVADHCASSAGKTDLPIHKYKIPLIVYSPSFVSPSKVDTLSSQIDVMPTVLGLLGWSYESKFYGSNILSPEFRPRAFVGNYQKLGLLRDDKLTILMPNKTVKESQILTQSFEDSTYQVITPLEEDKKDIISYYQSQDYFHKNRLDRYNAVK